MAETIHLGEVTIAVTRKDVKNVRLSVHPPDGRVTLVTPKSTRPEVARAYAVSRLGWIRKQQGRLREQSCGVVAMVRPEEAPEARDAPASRWRSSRRADGDTLTALRVRLVVAGAEDVFQRSGGVVFADQLFPRRQV